MLITGGAGYIGTHVLCTLAKRGRSCISLDNYSNSSPRTVERIAAVTGEDLEAFEIDIRDTHSMSELLANREIDAVIHLAGLKAVGESVRHPERHHDNNVRGTIHLLEALRGSSVRRFVFGSSATVYGAARRIPIDENTSVAPTNSYGENKLEIERILQRLAREDPSWRIAILRYFNPVGAHASGLIGEDPRGIPNKLTPYLCQTAIGRRAELQLFGNDYPTPDGTGVRDYIHVMDLAEGHVAALEALGRVSEGTVLTVKLGTGRGHSVLGLVQTFERVNGVNVPRRLVARRPGDVAVCYADASYAMRALAWQAKRDIEEMCRDAWNWQANNPDGYSELPGRYSVRFGTVPISQAARSVGPGVR